MKRTLRSISIISTALLISGCTNPATFKSVGSHKGDKYVIEIARGNEALNPSLSVLLNGNEAMRINKVNMFKDPNCQKTTISSWRCEYSANYKNMKLLVVEETNTTVFSNSLNYDIYLDDEYVQRVIASIL